MSKLLVIGFSAGGLPLAQRIVAAFGLPVALASDKARIQPGHVYVAPPGYHVLVERDRHFGLSVDPPVNSVRPSIDVLLQSAAEAYEHQLIAVILSGANSDGVRGMAVVKELGGVTIVLDPLQTEFHVMPTAVVEAVDVDYVASPEEIISLVLAARNE
ncbi:MAG: CheB methylesterase [Proteobacteria bacterium]|nr:CheB methylesterase [Pseudomonadota bacterium]